MSDSEYEIGPVDYLIVEWPAGTAPNGEGLTQLGDLSERGIIRVLDLVFVRKEQDGAVTGLALTDIDNDGSLDLVEFQGAASGLLAQDDYDEAGASLEAGSSAAILVYENTWAAPFVAAVRKTGAEVVASGRIPADALEEVEEAEV